MRLGDLDALAENLTLLAKYEDAFTANVILGVASTVRNTKSIDAVPVVRCKDCNKWSGVALGSRCKHFSFPPLAYCYTNADDFCSRGERNEG